MVGDLRVIDALPTPGAKTPAAPAAAECGLPIVNARGEEISLGRERGEASSTILSRPAARAGLHESLRHLQGRILASLPQEGNAVIAVCSAVEGEGKTTVAVALAEMLAEQFTRQTLLVDANLNTPQLHSLLDTQSSPGLKDCLSKGSVLTSAIRWTGRMWLMPAGLAPAIVPDGPEAPGAIFRLLRNLFRLTIVDLPAVNSRHTAAMLPYWADGVVWVVRADSTPAELANDAMELVGKDSILGVVLNGHRSRLPGWLDRIL